MLREKWVNHSFTPIVYFLFLTLSVLFTVTSHAQGDLMVFPKRILFEGAKRSQEINLANSGKDTARYVLSVIQIRMKEDGSFEQIAEPDQEQKFADKYFRIFPRNVVLAPNEAQTVKVQLINTGEIQPGEYRSHLYIRSEEEKKPLGEKETPADSNAISVKLVAIFGISIPVIIRSGENNTSIKLSDLSFKESTDTAAAIKFTLNRNGNMSVYGDVTVDYLSPEGKSTRVATVNGLAVYCPTGKRSINLALNKTSGLDFHKGNLRLTYTYDSPSQEKSVTESMALH